MRTTLDIADDVLLTAKARARQSRRSLGEVLSELARIGLQSGGAAPAAQAVAADTADKLARLGIRVLPLRGAGVVTDELVKRIREEDGI